jgi:insulysin
MKCGSCPEVSCWFRLCRTNTYHNATEGVRITFGGYSDKLKKYASFITRKLTSDMKDILPKDYNDFDRYKDQIMRGLSSFDVQQPYSHASYYSQLTLQPRRFQYTNRELREATRKTTLPDLVAYAKAIWASGKGLALIQGNFDQREALDLVKSIGDVLPFRPIPESELPPRLEALPLPQSPALTLPPRLLVAEPNPSNENCVSHVTLQSLDKSELQHVLIEVIGSIIEEPFYNELRTKKQLGYIVASGLKGLAETRTLSFVVQSNVAASGALTLEILNFLDRAESEVFSKLTQGDVAVYAKSLIEKKTEPDRDLAIEVTRNWSEIASGRNQFDRLQQEAAALLSVKKEDVLRCWQTIYAGSGRRILVTEMIPASTGAPPATTGYGRRDFPSQSFSLGVDDIAEFRRVREQLVYTRDLFDFPKYSRSTFEAAIESIPESEDVALLTDR